TGGGEDQAPAAGGGGRLGDHARAGDVRLPEPVGILAPPRHERAEMEHRFGAFGCLPRRGRVREGADGLAVAGMINAGRAQVEAGDRLAFVEETARDPRSDATGTAGDDDTHGTILMAEPQRMARCVSASKTCRRAGSKDKVMGSPVATAPASTSRAMRASPRRSSSAPLASTGAPRFSCGRST